jgi:anti-sigma B factor antagonist
MAELIAKKKLGIVLDLNKVTFIDSKGLEYLLWLRDYCCESSCSLKLAALNENCAKILEITRLEKDFDSYGELADAVKSLA